MGGEEAGLEFKQSRAGALSLSATLHGHLRLPQKSEGESELAKGRGAERAWGGVGGGLWKAPSNPSRRPLPAAPAALAVPVNLLLTEEALDVGSEGRSQKTEPLSLLAHPCACSGGEGLRHAGCGPRATSLCGQVLATVVETLGSRFCPR